MTGGGGDASVTSRATRWVSSHSSIPRKRRLVFASEIKALLASGLVAAEIDPIALRLLDLWLSKQPNTILKGVNAAAYTD